jgi:hypothetical protein
VTQTKWPVLLCVLAVVALGSTRAAEAGRDGSSVSRAAELMSLMQAKGLQTFAVRLPDQPDKFIAVMAFPDVQLLVVTARHANPDVLASHVAQKQFSDVYSELQTASSQDSRTFFQDLGGDGLGLPGGVDVMYERGVQTLFDGNWKRAKLSREAYDDQLAAADKRYTQLLDALINGLTAS